MAKWARWVLPLTLLAMHVGILLLQNILFFGLILLQATFLNLRPLREALGHRRVLPFAFDPEREPLSAEVL